MVMTKQGEFVELVVENPVAVRDSAIWQLHVKAKQTMEERKKHRFIEMLSWGYTLSLSIVFVMVLATSEKIDGVSLSALAAFILGAPFVAIFSRRHVRDCEATFNKIDAEFEELAQVLGLLPEDLARMYFGEVRARAIQVLYSTTLAYAEVKAKHGRRPIYSQPRWVEEEWNKAEKTADRAKILFLNFRLVWSSDLDQAALSANQKARWAGILRFPA